MRRMGRLFYRLREWMIEKEGLGVADTVLPGWEISGFPKLQPLSASQTASTTEPPVSFAAPDGHVVDPQSMASHQAIQRIAKRENLSYDMALKAFIERGGR